MHCSRYFPHPKEKILLSGIALAITAWLSIFQKVVWTHSLLFFAALLLVFYLPGNLLVTLTKKKRTSFLFDFIESIGLGLALVPVIYVVIRKCTCEFLIGYFLAAIAMVWLVVKIKRQEPAYEQVVAVKHLSAGISLIVLLILILLQFSHFTDVVRTGEELKIHDTPTTETVFHLGIVNALKYNFPPPQIYASGSQDFSSYHLYMHLQIELLNRLFPLDTIDLVFHYFPAIYFLLISLLPFVFFTERYQSPSIGLLTGILVFGADLSFIPGLLKMGFVKYSTFPWVFFFPNTIWSIFTLNGYLPSIFVLFLALIYLHRYCEERRPTDLIVYSVLILASTGFKTTLGIHLATVSFVLGVLFLFQPGERSSRFALLSAMLATLTLIALEIIVFRGGTGGATVAFNPFNLFYESISKLDLQHFHPYLFPLIYFVYLLATFGVRIGIFYYFKNCLKRRANVFIIFLVLFCLSGFVVSEFVTLGYEGDMINNSQWFASQSLICAWILFGILFMETTARLSVPLRIVAMVTVLALTFPSTIEFLTKRYDNKYFSFDSNALGVINYLDGIEKNAIILNPPEWTGPSLAANLAGRTTFLSEYLSFLKKDDHVSERFATASMFFKESTSTVIKKSLVDKFGIDYIYAGSNYAPMLMRLPFLNLVYKNSEYLILKVK